MAQDPDAPPTQYRLPRQGPPAQPEGYPSLPPATPEGFPPIPPAPSFSVPGTGAAPPTPGRPWYPQRADDQSVSESITEPMPQTSPAASPPLERPSLYPPSSFPEAQESYTPPPSSYYQPAPAAPAARAGTAGAQRAPAALSQPKIWRDLSVLMQGAGVAGLLLLLFFFLPWMFSPAFTANIPPGIRAYPTVTHSGWSVANGVPIFDASTQLSLFPHLWLVPLCALALIAVALLVRANHLSLRLASALIVSLAFLALLMEFFFLVQVNSIEGAFAVSQTGINTRQAAYGLSWGFWLAVIVTIVALGLGLFVLLQEYGLTRRLTPGASTSPGEPEQQMRPTA